MGYDETSNQAVWNFDGAEMQAIFEVKAQFINEIRVWSLEDAFWTVRTLRMEIDAKLAREKNKAAKAFEQFNEEQEAETDKKDKKKSLTEKEEVDNLLLQLEQERQKYLPERNDSEVRIQFFLALEKFYMHLCWLMKKHGMYFREGEDNTLAVLKR